jgi:hypothetical protein
MQTIRSGKYPPKAMPEMDMAMKALRALLEEQIERPGVDANIRFEDILDIISIATGKIANITTEH